MGSYQFDSSTPSRQIIVPLQIEETRDFSKRNTDNLQKDLDTMIVYKDFTEFSKRNHTSCLDSAYGYKSKGNLFYYCLLLNYFLFSN